MSKTSKTFATVLVLGILVLVVIASSYRVFKVDEQKPTGVVEKEA